MQKKQELTKEQDTKQLREKAHRDLDIFIQSVVEDSGNEQFITDGYGFHYDLLNFVVKLLSSQRKEILEEVRKLIGEDEQIISIEDFILEFETATENVKKSGRNELRAEQRQKLSELEGESAQDARKT